MVDVCRLGDNSVPEFFDHLDEHHPYQRLVLDKEYRCRPHQTAPGIPDCWTLQSGPKRKVPETIRKNTRLAIRALGYLSWRALAANTTLRRAITSPNQKSCQVSSAKIFLFRFSEIHDYPLPI